MKKPMRILSGIQPSGILHIGNYFGMMRPAIALQDEGEAFYFIADYHALTSLRDPIALRENSRRVAHSGADRSCSGNRWPKNEQELRQHHRHFRRRKGNAETGDEHCN